MSTKTIREIKGFFYSQQHRARIPIFNAVEINTTVQQKDMDKHISGKMTVKNGGIDKFGRPKKSYWRNDLNERQINEIVLSSVGKGKVFKMRDGSYRELIKYGQNIGKYVDLTTGSATNTDRFIIHYAKDGLHAYPCDPKKEI